MIVKSINGDGQTTIPEEVLRELGVSPGEEIGFDIIGGRVVLTRPDGGFGDEQQDDLERLTGLDRATLQAMVEEALADPRPSIPAEQVFAELGARHQERNLRGG